MTLVALLGSVEDAEDEDGNEDHNDDDGDNDDGNDTAGHAVIGRLGGEGDLGGDGALDVVDDDLEGLLGEVGDGSTGDGTSVLVEGEAGGEGGGDVELVLGSDGEGRGDGVLSAGGQDVGLGAVADESGGDEVAELLGLGAEDAAGAGSSLVALVTDVAVLVSVAAFGGAREAVERSAGERNDGGVEAQLGELDVAGAAVDGVEGGVGALSDGHSVGVVGDGVVEGVGEGLSEVGEVLLVSVVQHDPVLVVVGGLEDPGGGVTLVAVVAVDDGVLVDHLTSQVVVGPLEPGALATGTGEHLGLDVVIEHAVDALEAGLGDIGAAGTVEASVLVVGDGGDHAVELVGGGDGGHLVDLDGEDVLTADKEEVVPVEDGGDHDVVAVLGGGEGGVGDAGGGEVDAADLLAVKIEDHTGVGLGADLKGGHLGEGAGVGELESVVLGGAGDGGKVLGGGGGPAVVVEAEGGPAAGGGAAVEELPVVAGVVDDSADVDLDGLGGLAVGDAAEEDDGAILEGHGVVSVAPAIVGGVGEDEGVDAVGHAEAVVDGGPLDGDSLGADGVAVGAADLPAGLGGAAVVEAEGHVEEGVGASADLDGDEEGGGGGDALDASGGDGVLGAGHDGGGNTVDVTVGAVHGQGGGEGGGDLEVVVVLGGAGQGGGGDASVGLVVGGGEGEGRNDDGVHVLLVELELADDVAVGVVEDHGSLGDEADASVGGAGVVDVEALSLAAGLPGDVDLGGDVDHGVVAHDALKGPVGDIVTRSIPAGDDAVLVDVLGLTVGEGDLEVVGGDGVVDVGDPTGIRAAIEGVGGGAIHADVIGVVGAAGELEGNVVAGSEVEDGVELDVVGGDVEAEETDGDGDGAGDGGDGAGDGLPGEAVAATGGRGGAADLTGGKVVAVDLVAVNEDDDTSLGLEVQLPGLHGGGDGGGGEGLSEEDDSLGDLGWGVEGESLPAGIAEGSGVPTSGDGAGEVLPGRLAGVLEAGVDTELLSGAGEHVEVGDTEGLGGGVSVVDVEEVVVVPALAVIGLEEDSPVVGVEALADDDGGAIGGALTGGDDGVGGVVDGPSLVVGRAVVGLADFEGDLVGLAAGGDGDGQGEGAGLVGESVDGRDGVGLVDAGLEGAGDDTGLSVDADAGGEDGLSGVLHVAGGDGGDGEGGEDGGGEGGALVLEADDEGLVVGDDTELGQLEVAAAEVLEELPLQLGKDFVVGAERIGVDGVSAGEGLGSGLLVEKDPGGAVIERAVHLPVLGVTSGNIVSTDDLIGVEPGGGVVGEGVDGGNATRVPGGHVLGVGVTIEKTVAGLTSGDGTLNGAVGITEVGVGGDVVYE